MDKLIGLDLGKTIGVAILIEQTAMPTLCTRSIKEVAEYITKQKPKMLIVGWPLLLSGKEGEQCMKTKQILNEILKLTGPIEYKFQDERFSSKFNANMQDIDALSAAWILQKFINSSV